ncbi:hypothetical protein BHU72_05540 [Desulfuribacillus stibiiarsenatis]|uniref:Uncharacterized protein n=1 Tax=Desulfuribacillus stibiiarsenatis TaxID=1390249 RepID=A0A1E5L4T6_9FIRM|nr:hypothetical protein [Desulfuribacillus stibiiarsenatis]OEH85074.1 hypothetical protein BHU72_05540 [Desulfuribacillus stibiiarsenatis]
MLMHVNRNRLLWIIVASMALIAAIIGVILPSIYSKVCSEEFMPGVMSQDIVTILSAVSILILTIRLREENVKQQITVLGLLGYIFYAYGIYVMERFYNPLYFLYMGIFGLAFYSIIYAVICLLNKDVPLVKVTKGIKNVSIGFALFIPILFYPMWVSLLLPLLSTGEKIEFAYSVFILDMVFILPLFFVIAYMAYKNMNIGLLLLPTLFIKGFTLLLSVAIGVMLKPLYLQVPDYREMFLYLSVSIVFLIITFIYFRKMSIIRV